MIHVVNRRASGHPDHCEDAYHYEQRGPWLIAAVFDGCSDGIRSHYASQMHAYALRRSLQTGWPLIEQNLQKGFKAPDEALNDLCALLALFVNSMAEVVGLTILESLSTVVISMYNAETKYLVTKFLRDGVLYVDGEYTRVTSGEANTPDYIAYMEEKAPDSSAFVDRPTFVFPSAKRWAICSDGVDAIKHPYRPLEECLHYLLEDTQMLNLDRMLRSKVNILEKEHMVLNDDLTIIRYDSV